MEINDFISSADPTPVADVILAHAMQAGKTWNDQTDYEKQQSMIAAIIAYLEQEKRKPWQFFTLWTYGNYRKRQS